MANTRGVDLGRLGWLALAWALQAPAWAGCSRPFAVPVAPTGMSVTIYGPSIGGIYPELLRDISARSDCAFTLSVVPRARLEALFEAGKADLLLPATRTPRRDQMGHFVALIASRATAISIDPRRAPLRSIQEIVERRTLRVVLVRGFDYGEAYQAMLKQLSGQGRLFLEADPSGVARLLNAGHADLTIMAPSILAGAIMGDGRVDGMLDKLRIEALDELPWGESGAYISKATVGAEDRATLERLLGLAAKSGAVWDGFKRHYPAHILAESIRPR